jgi:hypothetical protein
MLKMMSDRDKDITLDEYIVAAFKSKVKEINN